MTYNHLTDPARIGRITASSVGAILGHAPYMDRNDVMRSMIRASLGAEEEFKGNIATEYGKANEANAIMDFEMDAMVKVKPSKFITKEDWAGCSPDGRAEDGLGVEIKCPFKFRKTPVEDVKFQSLIEQPHYYDQVQFSLWVTDWRGWYFAQYAPSCSTYEAVKPDLDWQNENLPKLRQFYSEYLHELENNAEEYLKPKRVEIGTPEAKKMLRECDELKEQIELLTEKMSDILDDLILLSDGRNAEICGRKLTLVQKAGGISYAKAVKELCPDADLEKWRGKPSSYWKLG